MKNDRVRKIIDEALRAWQDGHKTPQAWQEAEKILEPLKREVGLQ